MLVSDCGLAEFSGTNWIQRIQRQSRNTPEHSNPLGIINSPRTREAARGMKSSNLPTPTGTNGKRGTCIAGDGGMVSPVD